MSSLTSEFFHGVLNSLTEHIAVIDSEGTIHYVNDAWNAFARENRSPISEWSGVNYLKACDSAASRGDEYGQRAFSGIRDIIDRGEGTFSFEYPCHSATEQRWFMMSTSPLHWAGPPLFVISHRNITERKLAEENVRKLSLTDELTGVANRRHFDSYLQEEWRRAARLGASISLILLDIDHFKLFNDEYGHPAGDDCLRRIGGVMKAAARRAGDLAARYGGEEFALILENTNAEGAQAIANRLLSAIRDLRIPHTSSPSADVVTASLGVATAFPDKYNSEKSLVDAADEALYRAKGAGRNRVCVE